MLKSTSDTFKYPVRAGVVTPQIEKKYKLAPEDLASIHGNIVPVVLSVKDLASIRGNLVPDSVVLPVIGL